MDSSLTKLKLNRILRHSRLILRYRSSKNYPVLKNVPSFARGAVISRIFFLKSKKLYYARIPKAANSTVVLTLMRNAGYDELGPGSSDGWAANKGKTAFNFWPTPEEFEEAYKFTIIRDPFERIISAWRDKAFQPRQIALYKFAGDKTTAPTLIQFLESIEENDFFSNGHFIPQRSMIPGNIIDYKIGTVETLDHDLKEVCEEVFGNFKGITSKKFGKTHAGNYVGQLTQEERKKIKKLYQDDFEIYNEFRRLTKSENRL